MLSQDTHMTPQTFREQAGGIYRSNQPWSRLDSGDKRRLFWHFFFRSPNAGDTIYAGVDLKHLKQLQLCSIEHIIPRSYLDQALRQRPRRERNGASTNPFNLAPCHQRINQIRGNAPFDFDGDPLEQRFSVHMPSTHPQRPAPTTLCEPVLLPSPVPVPVQFQMMMGCLLVTS